MQAFSRRGYQLRSAPLETKVAYSAFLVLTLLGMATFVALSIGRMGLDPRDIAAHYRGEDNGMSASKALWKLVEMSHFHLFSIPVVVLTLAHLLYAASESRRANLWLTVATYLGAFLSVAGPWAVRYLAEGFAYLLIVGWMLLASGLLLMIVLSLMGMWLTGDPPSDNLACDVARQEGT